MMRCWLKSKIKTTKTSEIIYEIQNRIVEITLNRPEKRKALNDALINSLKDALRKADIRGKQLNDAVLIKSNSR